MEVCKACGNPATLDVEGDDGSVQHIPDDVELICGCHWHWQCLMDHATEITATLTCPSCSSSVALPSHASASSSSAAASSSPFDNIPPIMAKYTNEGGLDPTLNLTPQLVEEAYLAANPSAAPSRAIHIMCREGDVAGIVDMLAALAHGNDEEDDDDEEMDQDGDHETHQGDALADILLYADPLNGDKTGLHFAVENGHADVTWLLLWLVSCMKTEDFPPEVVQSAEATGVERLGLAIQKDIRSALDRDGRTANDLAREVGGACMPLVQAGVLLAGPAS